MIRVQFYNMYDIHTRAARALREGTAVVETTQQVLNQKHVARELVIEEGGDMLREHAVVE